MLKINTLGQQVRAMLRDYPQRSPIHLYMERLNALINQAGFVVTETATLAYRTDASIGTSLVARR